jgi:hypothetical protein
MMACGGCERTGCVYDVVVCCDVCVVVEGIAARGWETRMVRSGSVCIWYVVVEGVALDGVGCRCVLCVLVGCFRCRLQRNRIGADGGRAIGAARQYLPSLTVLEYVRSMGHAEEAKE